AGDIKSFLSDNGYTFPVVMDEGGTAATIPYGISAYPTTYMIDSQGNIYGYVSSALTMDIMESIVTQTQTGAPQAQ
ncbi:MAG: TlpA disulfide reductase family protein, partial [Christensenella sp.]